MQSVIQLTMITYLVTFIYTGHLVVTFIYTGHLVVTFIYTGHLVVSSKKKQNALLAQ